MSILAVSAGVVTAVRGEAFIRSPQGDLLPVKVGDSVPAGQAILGPNGEVLETMPAPQPEGMPELPSGGRQRYYRRALTCVGIAAFLLVLFVMGVFTDVSTLGKVVVGLAFVLFSVLSMHYMIEFVRVAEPGRQRND